MTGASARTRLADDVPPFVDGVLVIDKPEGPTSHDVVACARRALGVRRVGHTGTLDPLATGVLALVVGRATRLAQFLSGREKQYLARIRLGVATDSWDRTGAILSQVAPGTPLPGADAVAHALAGHLGEQEQVPPTFSAKKVDGIRAYALARQGRAAGMTAARVTLHAAVVEGFEPPFVDVRLTCSAGFYVRALADSLGRRLGCGASLEALRRTASGSFTLDQAVPLDRLEEPPGAARARLLPIERALPDLSAVTLTADGTTQAIHGNDVGPGHWTARGGWPTTDGGGREAGGAPEPGPSPFVQLLAPDGRLVAIARPAGPAVLHPVVVLR
jgi:tRNA pseudouridine55 synthase